MPAPGSSPPAPPAEGEEAPAPVAGPFSEAAEALGQRVDLVTEAMRVPPDGALVGQECVA